LTLIPPADRLAMSRRAQTYIFTGGARHLIVGLTMIAMPWLYSSAAFIPIFNLLGSYSIVVWAWVMTVVGLACTVGAFVRNPTLSRWGMVGSAVVTLVLGAGLTIGVVNQWIIFSHAAGWDNVVELILSRPTRFPADLLGLVVAPPSPFLPILLLSVAVKDFTMCAQPLRVPLEDT
jgi:hypothetical protein